MMVMVASQERHLTEERKIIQEAIVGQGGFPVGMAYPSVPANYIHKLNLQCVADADYVLLLIGTEYGALTVNGLSYTHAIYTAAKTAKKPILSLIFNGQPRIAQESFDQKRLAGLIDVLKHGAVHHWHNHDTLRDATEIGLEHLFESHPSAGWVKASQKSVSADTSNEHMNLMRKLKRQVAELSEKLHSVASKPVTIDSVFDAKAPPWAIQYHCNAFREGRLEQVEGQIDAELLTVFKWTSASLLSPIQESKLRAVIAKRIQYQVLIKTQSVWRGCHAVSDVRIGDVSIDELKMRFRALGLVSFDDQGRWRLSPVGEQLALQNNRSVSI